MIYNQVLIRFGELMLKGKNRHVFIKKTIDLIKQNIKDLNVQINSTHDRVYLQINDCAQETIVKRLKRVSGIYSFSFVKTANKDLESIIENSVKVLNKDLKVGAKLKIETKRADKRFPYTSLETTQQIAPKILQQITKDFSVDVRNPSQILTVEIRDEGVYIYLDSILGLGGFPVGIAGKALSLLSGGIDSPVASYLAMKQGVLVEAIHFESTPLTPLEGVQKVIDLAEKLAYYTPNHKFVVWMVPFLEIHQNILKSIPDAYNITVMRRIMIRIAEKLARRESLLALITGESLGQVASQTLESINTIEEVCRMPILRPVLTYDKNDIINLATEHDFYEISIRPFSDCCTVYLPKKPATKPTIDKSMFYEKNIAGLDELIEKTVNEIEKWVIKVDEKLDITMLGLTAKEAKRELDKND